MRRRKRYAGAEWATRDVNRVGLVFILLVLGAYHPFFVVLAIAVGIANLIWYGIRVARRRRREQANADAPFWVDRIKP